MVHDYYRFISVVAALLEFQGITKMTGIMATTNMTSPADQWQLVTRRRKPRRPTTRARPTATSPPPLEPSLEVSAAKQTQIVRRVGDIARVLRKSPLVLEALRVIADHFALPASKELQAGDAAIVDADAVDNRLELVGYGLGSFCGSSNAVHQLAFLVALREALTTADRPQCHAEIFDPAMSKIALIQTNERGRRRVTRNTVFFMPHCGKALYQNVLACNWGLEARKLVVIGNSFAAYGDRVLVASERQELLLVGVLPYVEETPLSCGVAKSHEHFSSYEAAFNDLSVHSFPSHLLQLALRDDVELTKKMAVAASQELLDGELVLATASSAGINTANPTEDNHQPSTRTEK
ncbi:hypothetical protein BBJ28_00005518 [Nothophytophthora sp. Chile5]|nr:hypothetical protein BBJ28_00005518 [Nothophytophthora sp. Chile5]